MNKRTLMIILASLALIVTVVAGYYFYNTKITDKLDEDKVVFEEERNQDEATNEENIKATEELGTGRVEVFLPVEGTKLVGADRIFRGKSINSGGKVYYTLEGIESGILAEGVVEVSDNGIYADFSKEIIYSRKPMPNDKGNLIVYIFKDGKRTEITKIGVGF